MLTYLSLHMLTIDIATIFAKKLQSMRVIMLNRLRDVDNISISVMIPTHQNKTIYNWPSTNITWCLETMCA